MQICKEDVTTNKPPQDNHVLFAHSFDWNPLDFDIEYYIQYSLRSTQMHCVGERFYQSILAKTSDFLSRIYMVSLVGIPAL